MTAPTLTAPPTAPSRTDAPADFSANADATVAWLSTHVAEVNAVIPYFSKLGLVLAAAESSTSTTPALISDANGNWTIPVTAGQWYRILVLGTYQTAATTTGGVLNFTEVGSTGTANGFFVGALNPALVATGDEQTISSLPATLTLPSVTTLGVAHHIRAEFIYVCTGTGAIEVRWGTEVNASAAQLNVGSALLVERI